MDKVWYSADGALLYAHTESGKIFQTLDFETWEPASDAPAPPQTFAREPVRKPDPSPDAQYFSLSASSAEVWGAGRQLFRSLDGGQSWETLTSYKSASVIGGGISSVAVSPADSNQLAVANEYGVWRSLDGGLTWTGLNQLLPNLSVERILATPSGGRPARILTEKLGVLELAPGSTVWQRLPALLAQPEAAAKKQIGAKLGADIDISAFASSSDGHYVYAGSSDGRVWRSEDSGANFEETAPAGPGQNVERLFVDPVDPRVVLAALSGDGPHLLRTFDGGLYWDKLDSASLPNAAAHAVTADQGAVYVATDKGVYWTRFNLETDGLTDNLTWTNLSAGLPAAKAVDVALDPAGVQLYAAVEGYGVYGAAAPGRATGLRLVNTADFSTRPASPGSLISVLGQKVSAVTGGALPYKVWNNLLPSGDTADSQIQVPFEAVGPTVSLALETTAGTMTRDLQVLPVSPAIFVSQDGVPWIYDADSGLPLERNVAHAGQRLQVMVNGLGKVRPDWPAGQVAPSVDTPVVAAKVQAYLDGSEVPVARATLAPGYVGMYLVELQLPVVANYGAMQLQVTADSQQSNPVQIVIVP
jgi:uncharacterized protein (TIGR03437 family)